MKLSIIILSYNTEDILRNCLSSIFQNTPSFQFEVIVVDNNSSDTSVEMVRKEFKTVTLIENKINGGFSQGNNIGIKKAKGEYILLLNSDTIIFDAAFEKMVQFMDDTPQAGILGVKLLNTDKSDQPSCGSFPTTLGMSLWLFGGERLGFGRSSPQQTQEVDWVSGACLLIRHSILDEVGLLDEKFFMYFEEVEWCLRVKKKGYKIFFSPTAQIIHINQGSGNRSKAIIRIYESLQYFYQKHHSGIELTIIRTMLRIKAILSIAIGRLINNNYLTKTYGEALKLVR